MTTRTRVLARGCTLGVALLAGALVTVPVSAAPPAVTADGQGAQAAQWWLDELGVREAWQTTQGEGATVCLIDSGIDRGHPDLQGADIVAGGGPGNGFGIEAVLDPGHGTAMATWIVGQGHGPGNRDGILGVAPKARIISWSTNVEGNPQEYARATSQAVRGCVDAGADVINISQTGNGTPEDAAYAADNGVLMVGSSGNYGPGQSVENAYLGQLPVGGVMSDLAVWPASSRTTSVEVVDGRTPIALTGPSAGAPGADGQGEPILSATTVDEGSYVEGVLPGTSSASAITAGIAALVASAHPDLDAANIANRLISTATVPQGVESPSADYGFGVVNAAAAVNDEVPTVEANPLGDVATGDLGLWDGEGDAGGGPQPDASTGPISAGTIVTLLVGAGLVLAVVIVLIVVLTRRGRPRT